MLYPQINHFRQVIDLSGFWDFRFDDEETSTPIAVPASWNEQVHDDGGRNRRDDLGPAWYETHFELPAPWAGQRIMLRFGSVNYLAEVWLNGTRLGAHEGGHLPFEFDVTAQLHPENNHLVARVDGNLAFDRVPPGNVTGDAADFFESHADNYPQAQFDFFPFCGIHRPVLLYTLPPVAITDLTVTTDIAGTTGRVRVRMTCTEWDDHKAVRARFVLQGQGAALQIAVPLDGAECDVAFEVPDAALWSPQAPNLYDLVVELYAGETPIDRYTLAVGIRTIEISGDRLLLNGEPVYLTGFGRHEDFPVAGRGLVPAVIIKDYALMKWTGANSFRTSHYPYSEQMMDLADRLGFLVIDETPAVGLFFREDGFEKRQALSRDYVRALIDRDKNHPSVIAWSVANEPHSQNERAKPFFRDLYDLAKSLDSTRPVTLASFLSIYEDAFEFLDFICLNRYWGWYTEPGRIEAGVAKLNMELDLLHGKFGKPILLSEFGADTIPGCHAEPPEMFSEEYQVEFLTRYIAVLRSKPYVIGEHVWNLCDFKTSQGIRRMGGFNYKGVFTRDRRPKLAAHRLRSLWTDN